MNIPVTPEPEESKQPSAISEFVKEHPIQSSAAVASVSAFLCSATGFWREHLLLREFGVNAATFSEINDFLVAGLKDPLVLSVFPYFALSPLLFRPFRNLRPDMPFHFLRRFLYLSDSPRARLRTVVPLLIVAYPIILAALFVPISAGNEAEQIRQGENPLVVHMRSGVDLGSPDAPLELITTTDKYVFLWDSKSGQTLIVPSVSISHIRQLWPAGE